MDNCDNKNPAADEGQAPLHMAASLDIVEVCDVIIKYIENKHPRNQKVKTPLDYAELDDVKELFN